MCYTQQIANPKLSIRAFQILAGGGNQHVIWAPNIVRYLKLLAKKWRRGESNPRPEAVGLGVYVRRLVLCSREPGSHGQDTGSPAREFSSAAPERSPPLIPICVA